MTAGSSRRDRFRLLPCALPDVEAVEADSGRSFARHSHEQFGIGIVLRGAQRSHSHCGPVEAAAGDVIMVNLGEAHDGTALTAEGRAWRMLYFDPAVIAAAVADATEGRAAQLEFAQPVVRCAALRGEVQALFSRLTLPTTDALGTDESLVRLIGRLSAESRSVSTAISTAIGPAREIIDQDPAASPSLADLAQACGLSRFQLLRGFAKATGLTPHAYLVQRRMGLARRLIGRGARLAEVAAASGFADQSHMTRHFVGRYGLTPGAYARAVV